MNVFRWQVRQRRPDLAEGCIFHVLRHLGDFILQLSLHREKGKEATLSGGLRGELQPGAPNI